MAVIAITEDSAKPLSVNTAENSSKDIRDIINGTHTEELVITLCGYIGTDIHGVGNRFKNVLERVFNYEVEIIKMSSFIKKYSAVAPTFISGQSRYEYVKKLIDGGNQLRKDHGNSILAQLAIQRMNYDRVTAQEGSGNQAFKSRRLCYIIDSVKHTEELDLFKEVYTGIHYSVGVFASLDLREAHLKHSSTPMMDVEIGNLIDRDSGEELVHGQQVRDTFTKSDYFIRLEGVVNDSVEVKLLRFLHLVFGSKVITPTSEETAMYQAASAANNSACLSRQVGAALTDAKGDILSIGWNDVPKAHGGLYKSDIDDDPTSKKDKRCFNIGDNGCFNDAEKNLMANELVTILIQDGIVPEDKRQQLFEKIRNSKIKSLVEFSRAIHAEMHAIISGCQTAGERVIGGKIFITTYPCHNCARHIIAAGIKEVYYIEPYRKSLTIKLHNDAITEKEGESEKVVILMYDGVAPARYMDLFKMIVNSRKQPSGSIKDYDFRNVRPKATLSLEAIPVLEAEVSKQLEKRGLKIV